MLICTKRTRGRILTLAGTLALLVAIAPGALADDEVCGPWSGFPMAPEDAAGLLQQGAGVMPADATASAQAAAGSVSFGLIFSDVILGTGAGFDDPVLGATRRATATAVFDYISSVLPQSGHADIQFLQSQTDGSGFLGSANPLADPGTIGCQVVFPILHILTGVDPSPGIPDGLITIDFGYTYNDDLGPVAPGERDLFSLLLHEASHAIGFASSLTTDNQGNGVLGQNPDIRVIGFDSFIETPGGNPMISCPDGTFIGVPGPGGDLEGPPSLVHTGPGATAAWQGLGNAGSPPLYTPTPHNDGSSITHWDTADPDVPLSAVMRHTLSTGVENRVWSPLELGAMQDLGYLGGSIPVPVAGPIGSGLLSVGLAVGGLLGLRRRPSGRD